MELPVGVESSAGEKQFWKYPKHLYEAYESATFHTVKHRLPQPVIFMLALVGVAVIGGLWAYSQFSGSAADSPPNIISSSVALSAGEPDLTVNHLISLKPVEVRPLLPLDEYIQQVKAARSLLGCARSAVSCKCWGVDGNPLLVSDRICSALMDAALPFNILGTVRKDSS
jgi:hypothetical protein